MVYSVGKYHGLVVDASFDWKPEGRKVVECHPHSNDRRGCEDMTEPSDLVYREMRRGPRTEP